MIAEKYAENRDEAFESPVANILDWGSCWACPSRSLLRPPIWRGRGGGGVSHWRDERWVKVGPVQVSCGEVCDTYTWVSEESRQGSVVPQKPQTERGSDQWELYSSTRDVVTVCAFPSSSTCHVSRKPRISPGTALSALSALHTLQTPVANTEQRGVSPAFPTLGRECRVPPWPLASAHCPVLSLGSKGRQYFLF